MQLVQYKLGQDTSENTHREITNRKDNILKIQIGTYKSKKTTRQIPIEQMIIGSYGNTSRGNTHRKNTSENTSRKI